jgi:predicted Rossmann-fold nucleotide-binding protein
MGQNPIYREAGLALGRSIAEHGLRLVYGGGTRGIMGAVSQGVMEAGGEVTASSRPSCSTRKPASKRRNS